MSTKHGSYTQKYDAGVRWTPAFFIFHRPFQRELPCTPGRKEAVRIFIHAPEKYQVKKVMEMYGDTEEAGRKSLAHSDSVRGAYYKSISGQDWCGPRRRKMCLD